MQALKYATFYVGKDKVQIDPKTSEKELKAIWDKHPSLRRFLKDDNDSQESVADTKVQPKPKSSKRSRKPKV